MSQQQTIWLYEHAKAKLSDMGFDLKPDEEGFAVINVSNPVLVSGGSPLATFGTLEGVSAWISGIHTGAMWQKNKVFDR